MSSGKIKTYLFNQQEEQKMTEVLAYRIFVELGYTCVNNQINFDSLLKYLCEITQTNYVEINKIYVKIRFTPLAVSSNLHNLSFTYFGIPNKIIKKVFGSYEDKKTQAYGDINKLFNNLKLCLNNEEFTTLKIFLYRLVYLFEPFKYLNFNYNYYETDVNRFITKDKFITKNKKRACEIYYKESVRLFCKRIKELTGLDYVQAIGILGRLTKLDSAELKYIYDKLRQECLQDYRKQVCLCALKFNISDKDVKTFFDMDKQCVNYFKRRYPNMTLQAMTDEKSFRIIRICLEKIYNITRSFAYCNVNKLEV